MKSTKYCEVIGYILVSLGVCQVYSITSNSACFGSQSTNATTMYLSCSSTQTITVVNVTAGAKRTSLGCPLSYTDSNTEDIACCSVSMTSSDDCLFAVTDITDFESFCNGKQDCQPQAANKIISGECDANFPSSSILMFIEYICVEQSTTSAPDVGDTEDTDEGLSPGETAGIAVGSVAGASSIGLAVFAARKILSRTTRVSPSNSTDAAEVSSNTPDDTPEDNPV